MLSVSVVRKIVRRALTLNSHEDVGSEEFEDEDDGIDKSSVLRS